MPRYTVAPMDKERLKSRITATSGLAAFMGGAGFIRLRPLPDDLEISVWMNVLGVMAVRALRPTADCGTPAPCPHAPGFALSPLPRPPGRLQRNRRPSVFSFPAIGVCDRLP